MINLFTIYNKNTKDYPGVMVMRHWEVSVRLPQGFRVKQKSVVGTGDTIEEMRTLLPDGGANLGRRTGEDFNIIESWMEREESNEEGHG